ncbi:MAG: DivIVA domain-containing protein [Microbacterium sp.]
MTTTTEAPAPAFPLTRGRTKGYETRAVDAFLTRARNAFEAAGGDDVVTAAEVRQVAFPLVRRGYSIAAVDTALGRIEEAFATREREAALARVGAEVWVEQARETAQIVLDRLSRPKGKRFTKVGGLRYGYRIDEVDIVADKIAGYLETGESVTPEQVRAVAFRMQRGGYREIQVDSLLDAVVEVMLAVR